LKYFNPGVTIHLKYANPLKPKTERCRKEVGGQAVYTSFNGVGRYIYGYEGAQAMPARPSSNGRFNEIKAFGSKECKEIQNGVRTKVQQVLIAFVQNF
jgi:hypothetical protein